jgi:hypothetical protein
VLEEKLSSAYAMRVYGIAFDDEGDAIDVDATRSRRQALRDARVSGTVEIMQTPSDLE